LHGHSQPTAETAVAPLLQHEEDSKKKKQAEHHHDHGHKGDLHVHHHPGAKKESRDDHFAETMLDMDKKKKHTGSKRHA
jgi:hypothetical protein